MFSYVIWETSSGSNAFSGAGIVHAVDDRKQSHKRDWIFLTRQAELSHPAASGKSLEVEQAHVQRIRVHTSM